MKRVEGHKHLFREDSGAIVNTDTTEYLQYVKLRSERRKQREEIDEKLGFELIQINENTELEEAFAVDYYPHVILSHKGK